MSTVSKGDIIAFFRHFSMLSNHYRCLFDQGGKTFNSVEQCFMYHKAKEFGDEATAHAILCSEDPAHAKALGEKRYRIFKPNNGMMFKIAK